MEKNVILNISMYSHLACEILTCFYVFIFKSKYDIYFLLYFLVILILKLIFHYECLWSVFDKKLINPDYVLGSEPSEYPFREIYGNKNVMVIIVSLILIEFFIIFFRNKNVWVKYLTIINFILVVYIELKISKKK
jgi:hypothetical protein